MHLTTHLPLQTEYTYWLYNSASPYHINLWQMDLNASCICYIFEFLWLSVDINISTQ